MIPLDHTMFTLSPTCIAQWNSKYLSFNLYEKDMLEISLFLFSYSEGICVSDYNVLHCECTCSVHAEISTTCSVFDRFPTCSKDPHQAL